jgi:hypothetical protein
MDFIKIHKDGRLLGRYHYLMGVAVHDNVNLGIVPRFFTKTSEDRMVLIKQRPLPEKIGPLKLFQARKKRWYKPFVVQRLTEYLISETEILSRLNQLEELFGEVPVAVPATVENVAVSVSEPDEHTMKAFLDMWEGNSMLLGRHAQENYYPREEVMKILDLENPLHVDIPARWTGPGASISAEKMLEREREALRLYEWVLSTVEDEPPPRDLIADDPEIVDRVQTSPDRDVYVVTDDVAMLRYAASMNWRKNVFRISSRRWTEAQNTIVPLRSQAVQDSVIIDLGSVNNFVGTMTDEEIVMFFQFGGTPLCESDITLIRATDAVAPREIREGSLCFALSEGQD